MPWPAVGRSAKLKKKKLGGGDQLQAPVVALPPGNNPNTHCIGGSVGPGAGIGFGEETKLFPLPVF